MICLSMHELTSFNWLCFANINGILSFLSNLQNDPYPPNHNISSDGLGVIMRPWLSICSYLLWKIYNNTHISILCSTWRKTSDNFDFLNIHSDVVSSDVRYCCVAHICPINLLDMLKTIRTQNNSPQSNIHVLPNSHLSTFYLYSTYLSQYLISESNTVMFWKHGMSTNSTKAEMETKETNYIFYKCHSWPWKRYFVLFIRGIQTIN